MSAFLEKRLQNDILHYKEVRLISIFFVVKDMLYCNSFSCGNAYVLN